MFFLRCIFLCCLFPFTELVFVHTNQVLLLFELIVYSFKIWYSYTYISWFSQFNLNWALLKQVVFIYFDRKHIVLCHFNKEHCSNTVNSLPIYSEFNSQLLFNRCNCKIPPNLDGGIAIYISLWWWYFDQRWVKLNIRNSCFRSCVV